ncbi:MAG: DUF5110 domain-containing protein [Clostridiales Family XIII bacterium]|jgi:alpha-D-xyloside xylohydrolase|nr:DUF5110 domain-containing protein [Clostridiales Family XIII bacterium]
MGNLKKLMSIVTACATLFGAQTFVSASPLPDASTAQSINLDLGGAKLKIQAYADDIVRVRYSPDGNFLTKDFDDDRYIATFVDPKADLAPIDMQITDDGAVVTAKTAKLDIRVNKSTGAVSYYDKEGALILAEKDRTFSPAGVGGRDVFSVTQRFSSPAAERLYGFGNVNEKLGLKGDNVSVRQTNTGKRTPMFVSNLGYGILFDMTSNGSLNWADGNATYGYTASAADSMDYYFFYGPEADAVVADYRKVTGQATMLPKSAFGYTQSRNRYASQTELVSIVNQFREKKIPLDTIVIDYYWWNGGFNNIMEASSNWNNLAGTMNTLHDKNVSASISIWPSFDLGTTTSNYLQSNYPGILLTSDSGGFGGTRYDPSSDAYRKAYWKLINDHVFSKGLDSIWLDACEPEAGTWASNGTNLQVAYGNARPIGAIYPLLTNKGVYEGQRSEPGNTKRVNSLSRGAVAGIQRYGIQSWSGDIASGFDSLRAEIKGVLNFSAAGLPYFSTDTGGYFTFNSADGNGREMFLRWLQFSTFNSIMRVHGENAGGGNNREPWQFGGEYEKYITSYINLRERLMPYTYSLAGKVTQDGYTMVRPLVFDFRQDADAINVQDQFMFGPSLLVNPVYTLGQREKSIYLPAGRWVDFWTGVATSSAGQTFTAKAPLDKLPLFVKAGSIIPMGPFIQYAEESADPTEIRVYMGDNGKFTLYEDEGGNYNYEQGKFSEIPFEWDEASKTLKIGARSGSFDGMLENRVFNLVFVQPGYGTGVDLSSKYQATVNYDGNAAQAVFNPDWKIPLPPIDPETLPKPEPAPKPLTAAKSMVGEWLFEEGEGLRIKDTSGHFNDGGLVTSDSNVWREGKSGLALNYTGGGNTFVQANNSESLQITNEVTFSGWIYPQSGSSNFRFIMSKGGNDGPNPGYPGFCLLLANNANNRLQLEMQTAKNASGATSKSTIAMSSGSIPYDQWTHVAFTWKGAAAGGDGIARIYVNGAQAASGSFSGPIGVNDEPLNIGRNSANNSGYPLCFYGSIDEARLFNYALTQDDIVKLANMQNVSAPNPRNISVTPGDSALTVTWDDPVEASLERVIVSCAPHDGGAPMVFNVPKGVGSQAITGLENGKYYQVLLQSVLSGGMTSEGVYVVGRAAPYMSAVENAVIYDSDVYGYVVNNSGRSLSGKVKAEVFEGGVEPVKTTILDNFIVAGMDMLRFKADIGDFVSGQTVKLSFVDENGEALSGTVTLVRRQTVPPIDPDMLPKPDLPSVVKPDAPARAMVGEWLFEEGTGTKINDTSGLGNDGVLKASNANVWAVGGGKQGSALNYAGGGNTFVEIANGESLQIADEITFSGWIRPSSGNSGYRFIAAKGGNDSGHPGYCLLLQNNANNRIQLEIQTPRNSSGATVKSTVAANANIPYDQWSHVAFTWKGQAAGGDSVARLYVNGAEVGSGSFVGPIGVNDEPLNIGRNSTNNAGYPLCFYGLIDETRLFNYALTRDEIVELANMRRVTALNPQNVKIVPGDKSVVVTWDDPDEESLERVNVACEPYAGGTAQSFSVGKGIETLTITGLENGEYYRVLLQSVLDDGRTSSGIYAVGKAAPFLAGIEAAVTHGDKLYGYVVNNAATSLSGKLVAEVFKSGASTPIKTAVVEDLAIEPLGMTSFVADLGEYDDDQSVKISYISGTDEDLAQPTIIRRTLIYGGYSDYQICGYGLSEDSVGTVTVVAKGGRAAFLIVAAYDAAGRLIDSRTAKLSRADSPKAYAVDFSLVGAARVRAFIWSDTFAPLAEPLDIAWRNRQN